MKAFGSFVALSSRAAQGVSIPEAFRDNPIVEQVLLISDVDGVVREGVLAAADPRIIDSIKALLRSEKINVTFLSGSPVDHHFELEPWRRGNEPLAYAFGSHFQQELSNDRVTIFGVFGAQHMNRDGSFEIVDGYSLSTAFELTRHLIHAFLKEVGERGLEVQRDLARDLEGKLQDVALQNFSQPAYVTAIEFEPIVRVILEHIDPGFCIINTGALIEMQTSHPLWSPGLFAQWLKEELNQPESIGKSLEPLHKIVASGVAKKGEGLMNYCLITRGNKGCTSKKHIEEKLKSLPNALIITIGDTKADFPMHQNAHIAFHVGSEKVWQEQALPKCTMVRGENGEDSQHVEGTLKVLELIKDAIGKPFYDFKYLPKQDFSGGWKFYSLSELIYE